MSDTEGKGHPPYTLIVQDDGNVVLYAAGNKAIFGTGT